MPILKCPECNHDVSSEAPFCPNCGYPMRKKEETYIRPEPIDPIWIKKYKKKTLRIKCIHLYITAAILALFIALFFIDRDGPVFGKLIVGFILICFLSSTFFICLLVKAQAFNIDGYHVVAYLGFFKDILIVENTLIDSVFSSTFHSTDIFAKLPNGKTILARFSIGSASICEKRN